MATPSYFVFDGDGATHDPRRPGSDDVGGYAKEDDQAYPPDPVSMLTALDWLQIAKLAVGMAQVVPAVALSIRFNAGTPIVDSVAAVGFNVASTDFTLVDNGNGDTMIQIAAGKLPPATLKPRALTLNDDVEIDRARAFLSGGDVRVVTKLGATGTDCAFTLELSGA